MVLETLIGLGMYASLFSNPNAAYAVARPHEIVLPDYGIAQGPFELEIRDAMPAARTDTTELDAPSAWYRRT